MGVFQTKVYKECYPFSREVLYNTERLMYRTLAKSCKMELQLL